MSTIQFSVRRRDLAWAIALVMLLSTIWVARGDQADAGVVPPPGEGIAVVYIAVGTNFADALGVGPGGGVDAAPIIIVPTNPPIPSATSAELVRLDPRTVQIVGGTAVISQAMEDALVALLPNATFPARIAGGDRYETNALFSQANFPVEAWLSIPTAAFTSVLPATDSVNLTPGAAYATVPMYAPVALPDGAEILALAVQVQDTDGADGIGVRLRRVNFGTDEVIADAFSGDVYAGGDLTMMDSILTTNAEIVNNGLYGYVIEVYASGATRNLVNVMINYRLGAP